MTLDTVKVELQPGSAFYVDTAKLERCTRTKPDGTSSEWYECNNITHGFKRVKYTPYSDKCEVEFSAKCLLEDYPKGVNIDTLERVGDTMTETGLVDVPAETLAGGTVRRADVARNLELTHPAETYLPALRTMQSNTRYHFDEHKGSVVFRSKSKRASERLTAYSKGRELRLAKNREFLKAAGVGVFHKLRGVLRVERNARSFSALRECAGQGSGPVKLLTLLEASEQQPVADLFDRIGGSTHYRLFFNSVEGMINSGMKPYEVIKFYGQLHILEQCQFNMDNVKSLLKVMYKGRGWRAEKEFREVLKGYLAGQDRREQQNTMELLDEVQTLLRAA